MRRPGGIVLVILLLGSVALQGCTVGNNGGDALAFIRGGALYRIQPDGKNLVQVASKRIIGFAWAPDHHSFVFRMALNDDATTPGPLPLQSVPLLPAQHGVVSIDGGNVTPLSPSGSVLRGDALWNAQGNRLIYRERFGSTNYWFQAQADQPLGIARKALGNAPAIPATAKDGSQGAFLDSDGRLYRGAYPPIASAQGAVLLALAQHSRPTRILWQPNSSNVLVPLSGSETGTTVLRRIDEKGNTFDLATILEVDRWSFAPDGAHLLWRTAHGYVILSLTSGQQVTWSEDDGIPWWAPDSKTLLFVAPDHASLVDVATGRVQRIVQWTPVAQKDVPPADAFPVTGSPWSPDGQRFALALPGGTWLLGQQPASLKTGTGSGTGIYIFDRTSRTLPSYVDWGEHAGLSWSTPDPNTQWLWP